MGSNRIAVTGYTLLAASCILTTKLFGEAEITNGLMQVVSHLRLLKPGISTATNTGMPSLDKREAHVVGSHLRAIRILAELSES